MNSFLSTCTQFICKEDMFGADDADWAIYRKIVSDHTLGLPPSLMW